jgi:hypothetical protein
MATSPNAASTLIWNIVDGHVARPREDAPGAPRKARKATKESSPTAVTTLPFFLHGPAPGAPKKEPLKIQLSAQSVAVQKAMAAHIAAKFYPEWLKQREDDEDAAPYFALTEACELTPLALPEGPFKEMVTATFGYKTFTFDLDELWVDRNSNVHGHVVSLTVNVNMRKHTYPVDSEAAESVSAVYGHYEIAGTGKNFHKIWVTAKPAN